MKIGTKRRIIVGMRLARHLRRFISYLLLLGITAVMGFPILWMLSTALKTPSQANAFPPELIPHPFVWSNFYESMVSANFGRYFLNSILVSSVTVSFGLLFASLAGYTFAKLKFRAKNVLFIMVLSTMMVPSQVTMIPVFVLMTHFPLLGGNSIFGRGGSGLLNSYPGLIIPQISQAFGIFMMRQFMSTLPGELSDSARIDGTSEFGIFWRIMLPLSTAALITLGLFTFAGSWNDFIWPLVITNTNAMRTVQLGLSIFQGVHFTQTTLFMAGTTIATAPVLLLFLVGQRFFVKGIALSGIKG